MSKTNEMNSYLTFEMERELFAVTVNSVLEILEVPEVTSVPHSPAYMRGVINLRGTVLPLINTRVKFKLPKVEDTIDTVIIVIQVNLDGENVKLGIVVDAVHEVIELDKKTLLPPPSIGNKFKTDFITGVAKVNEEFAMVLDINAIFSIDDLISLKETSVEENEIVA